jgi:hypothetical protein
VALQALIEDHRHRKVSIDAGKCSRIQCASRRADYPETQDHGGIKQCALAIATNNGVHGKPREQRVGQQ